jgi:MFS family permease
VAVGLGATFVPLIIAATAGVENRDAGLASGLIQTAQQVGGALGLAILVTIATARTESYLSGIGRAPTPQDTPVAVVEGFQSAFLVGAVFSVVGAVLALLLLRVSRTEAVEAAKQQAGGEG